MSSGSPPPGFDPGMPPPPPAAGATKSKSTTWIVLVIVLAVSLVLCIPLLGIMVAIAVPSFLRAREISRRNACQINLARINGAKAQWELQNKDSDAPTWDELISSGAYLTQSPVCPAGGVYSINERGESPACSLSSRPDFPHEFPGQ